MAFKVKVRPKQTAKTASLGMNSEQEAMSESSIPLVAQYCFAHV